MNRPIRIMAVLFSMTASWCTAVQAGEGDGEKARPAVKWEYRVLSRDHLLEAGDKNLEKGLNKLGDEGWELVTIEFPMMLQRAEGRFASDARYYFKRPASTELASRELTEARLAQAQADVEEWKERVEWSSRMVKKGYATERQLATDRLKLKAAEATLEALRPKPADR